MAEGTGTVVPEPHQEIEDEPSILDTSFALTSQAGGEEGQIATPSTRQSQVGDVNASLIQTSSSEGGGDIAVPNAESQVGIANPNTHQATPSEGIGVPEPHQEIEDESSILDTNFDPTSQADREEDQIATPSTHQSQVGIANTSLFQTSPSEGGGEIATPNTESQFGTANPNTHQAKPYDVVVAGGDFKNANFGPHTSTSNFKGRNYVNQTFNYYNHSATNQGASNSASQQLSTRKLQENTELAEGCVRICDDTVMCTRNRIREGTNVYEGYQEHVSIDGVPNRLPVAIKKIPDSTDQHKQEVEHLLTLGSHPNVVKIIQSKERKTEFGIILFIVMELCGLRNLQDYLKENRENGIPFDFKKTLKFTKQLVKGMKYIHDNGIVHRDVKPENILLSADKTQLKFTDFGIGKKLRQGRTSTKVTSPGQGTTGYMAPETHSSDKVSKSGDIFSLGVTLFELWSNGLNPYGSDNISRDFNIVNNKSPDFSGLLIAGPLGNALLDLVKRMLQHDPRLRPTIDEVQKDIFFINAKIKSGEELLSSLNLGTRTPSDVESIRKQSDVQPRARIDAIPKMFEDKALENKGASSVQETTDQKQLATTSSDQPERTESTLQKQADVQPKGKPGFFRKIFGGTARRNVKASSVQETVDALMEDSKFKKAIDLLERLPQTQDQQMKLLECYVQLGRNSEVLKCVENMRRLVARHPRPKAVEVYELGLDNLEKSSHIKAIAYFACAAKSYSFESDADEAVRRMWDCSYKSGDVVQAMIIEQNERTRLLAYDVGMEIMNSIYCDVTTASNANPHLKAKMEACCLRDAGACYHQSKLYEKAIEVYKRGIDIMNRQFRENSSEYKVFGDLLKDMGSAYYRLGNYSEAESLHERSIDAYERAEDWPDDEEKKKEIERAENKLHNARRKKK